MTTEAGISITIPPVGDKRVDALLGAYAEVCKSYHAVDDFRMKLLGLLPFASLGGIFLLDTDVLELGLGEASRQVVAFAGAFAVVFTLALFIYEVRGMLVCHELTRQGERIERELNVPGQFTRVVDRCTGQLPPSEKRGRIAQHINVKLAACLVYSAVVAAWVFVTMRFGFDAHVYRCAITAPVVGLALAAGAYVFIRKLVAA